jgi:4-amino-4-deoxy-L-arabinose transferase-like glycosyltransferase
MFSSLRATIAPYLEANEPPRFRDWLSTPEPQRLRLPRHIALLLLLVVVCFIPRGLMAWRINTICVDGVVYFRLANDLENHHVAVDDGGHLQSGTYPMALAGLHRLGFDWETAAEFYGVLLSTLAVLPLFGWVRRQFDERVATVACLLYAFHPKLIEWSPEAVREPSFWFFFLLALYLLWRAAVEVDWRLFVAGGAVVALTCLTRFEGWFLLFPLVGWTALRFFRLRMGRWRLVSGFIGGFLTLPLVFFVFGQLLPGSNSWEHVRIEPIQRAGTWLLSWSEYLADTPEAPPSPQPAIAPSGPPPAAPATFRETSSMFVRIAERGLTPLFGIFMLAGLLATPRYFHRSENWPILLIMLAVAAGIWIHLWFAHQASSRYVLTIVLVTMQGAAIGVFEFGRLAGRWLSGRWPRAQLMATVGALAVVAAVGTVDAVSSDFRSRAALASLGRWIHDQYPRPPLIVGSENQLMLVGYYAQGSAFFFPPELSGEALAGWVEQVKPDAVVISKRRQTPMEYQAIIDRCKQLGLAVVEQNQIATPAKNILVLARVQPERKHIRQAALTSAIEP